MRAQPKVFAQRRLSVGARLGRIRPEMAADLVRLEYERTRLERTLAALDTRRATVLDQLSQVTGRASWIQGRLAEGDESQDAPARPMTVPSAAQKLSAPKRRN